MQTVSQTVTGSNNKGSMKEGGHNWPTLFFSESGMVEVVPCPLAPSAALYSFLLLWEQPSQHFETATFKKGEHKFTSQTSPLSVCLSVSPLSLTFWNKRNKTWVKSLLSGKCTPALFSNCLNKDIKRWKWTDGGECGCENCWAAQSYKQYSCQLILITYKRKM